MKERDEELDKMLASLKTFQPSPNQVSRWQKLAPRRPIFRLALQLTAAAFIGFIAGATFYKSRTTPVIDVATNFDSTATIEHVYIKSE